ncbi:MAG: ABC transporter permease [Clostridiales bacterium]|nr:ABC transporter permease [Clostridiales bacterium]MBR0468665.1 ABC transporter permease [Mogibacterium sp.]
MDIHELLSLLGHGTLDSLYMIVVCTVISYIIGLPIGVSLIVTAPGGIRPLGIYNKVMGFIVNILRSVPFLILMIALMPYIRKVIGTGIGKEAATAALIVAAAPFVARLVEQSLLEVDPGVIEAAQAMGASNMQIIRKVMLLEARPSLLNGAAVATINILGYTAMAGIVGAGGLGEIAIRYGLYRFQPSIMWITIVLLVILVQIFQEIGIKVVNKYDNRIN